MGYRAYTYLVIGYLLSEKKVTVEQVERVCSHEVGENNKFCPECGEPVWDTVTIQLIDDNKKYKDFQVTMYGSGDNPSYGVGIVAKSGYGEENSTLTLNDLPKDLVEYAFTLKEKLEEMGINVNIKDFGIHSVLYHSY